MTSSAFSISDSTSPMPSMRDTNRSAWNGSRSSSFSPLPTNAIGTPTTDTTERRAAARVAVDLRQDHAGDADLRVELARALDRVLPRHRVGDVEQIRRPRNVLDRDELLHQLVVDVQPAGGVDDDDVVADGPGLGQRALGARDRIHFAGRVVHPHTRLLRHDRQLLDRRRAPHVGRDDDRVAPCFASHFASLPVVVVLPEPCSPSIKSRAAGRWFPAARPSHRRTARAAHRERSDDLLLAI